MSRELKLLDTTGKRNIISQFSKSYLATLKYFHSNLRTTAEWILRNGGCVRFVGSPALFCDYNTLPPENIKFFVKEIEATNAGINEDGFIHIKGCEKLDRISLTNCPYITDEALQKMDLRKDSLKVVEISQCKNITEEGLRYLGALNKLEKLVVRDLPYVKNVEKVELELKKILVNCDVDIKDAQ